MADKLGWQLALYFIVVGYCSGQIGSLSIFSPSFSHSFSSSFFSPTAPGLPHHLPHPHPHPCTGQRGLKKVIKATGRESIVILLLGSIIGLACISMVVTGSISISQKAECGGYDFWTPVRFFPYARSLPLPSLPPPPPSLFEFLLTTTIACHYQSTDEFACKYFEDYYYGHRR